jgi:hypothetical protein
MSLAKYVISHLEGINPEELTTAERQILARAKDELKPQRITNDEHSPESSSTQVLPKIST